MKTNYERDYRKRFCLSRGQRSGFIVGMSKKRPTRRYEVVRTYAQVPGKMDEETKDKIADRGLTIATALLTVGVGAMISPTVGYLVAVACLTAIWSLITWRGWVKSTTTRYAGYGVIVVIAIVIALCLRSGAPKPNNRPVAAEQGVTVIAPNSPGSTNVAVGHANSVTVHQNDPNEIGTLKNTLDIISKKLDMAISTIEVTKEIPRLANEYDLGFVLIAFPGTVDATRVKPHSDKIQADWDRCKVYSDAEGRVFAKVPRFRIRGSPTDAIAAEFLNMGIPATPGIPFGRIIVGEVAMQSELLTQTDTVNCAVIGFKTAKAPSP